jgi:hypothetical protein
MASKVDATVHPSTSEKKATALDQLLALEKEPGAPPAFDPFVFQIDATERSVSKWTFFVMAIGRVGCLPHKRMERQKPVGRIVYDANHQGGIRHCNPGESSRYWMFSLHPNCPYQEA